MTDPKFLSSSLIKNSGDILSLSRGDILSLSRGLDMSPRDAARLAEIRQSIDRAFAKKSGRLVTDPRLSPADKAAWDAIAILEYLYGACRESQDVIAAIAVLSRRQVIRSISTLVSAGYVIRERSRARGLADVLKTRRPTRTDSLPQCSRCRACRPLDGLGVCVVCRKTQTAEREVAQWLEQNGPAPLTVVWAELYAHGSNAGRAAIRRAYLKLTEAA